MGNLSKTLLSAILASMAAAGCLLQKPASAPSRDAALKALAVSAGALSPAFASTNFSYAATAPHGTESLTVVPTAVDANVKSIQVIQDGRAMGTVASGSESRPLSAPAAGLSTRIAVKVTAEDGVTTRIYTIILAHAGASDASLASLTASAGILSPVFASATTRYTLSVPSETSAVTLTPVANDANARSIDIAQDGTPVGTLASGSTSGELRVPAYGSTSSIILDVIAQDGTTTQTYFVALKRTGQADASLALLTPSAGALSPAFASSTHSYDLALPFGTATLTVTPVASNADVHSIAVAQDGRGVGIVASGSPSGPLAVPAFGSTSRVTIAVTAQDGRTTETYALALARNANTDASLSSLAVSAGAMDPAFVSDVTSYRVSVPFATSSVTVTPIAHSSDVQSITVSQDGGAPAAVASGQASSGLEVPAVGKGSTVALVVTAADGATRRTYAVALTRAKADDASLSALVDSSGGLTGFTPGMLAYAYSVPYQTGTYTVTPTANDPSATILVNGAAAVSGSATPVTLSVGSNTVTIEVTSPDGAARRSYVLTITEARPVAGLVNPRVVPVTPSALATVSSGAKVPSGTTGANVPIDTLLRIGFDGPPSLGKTGKIQIFKSDGTLVDVINLADGPAYGAMSLGLSTAQPYINSMVNIIGGTNSQTSQVRFVFHTPIAISGNTAAIFPHKNRLTYNGSTYAVAQTLEYGASYYVTIDDGVFEGSISGVRFAGIADAGTWVFSTKATAPTGSVDPGTNRTTFTVNWDNSGDFATVQGGIDAVVKDNDSAHYTIAIAPGVYQELLFSRNKKYMTFKGTSGNNGVDTIIQYDNCEAFNNGVGAGTNMSAIGSSVAASGGGRAVYLVSGGDQIAFDGITLKNTHGQNSAVLPTLPEPTVSPGISASAEVLYFNSSYTLSAKHSNFVSFQDTLQLKGFTWFYDSFVTGDGDFVWGYPNLGLFEQSEIKSRYRANGEASIAQARAAAGFPGFVFLSSALTKEEGSFKAFLARSAGSSSYSDNVAYVRCTFDSHVDPTGWSLWNGASPSAAIGAVTSPTPAQGWRQYGNVTRSGALVDASSYLATSGGVIGSLNLSDANAASFFKDRATLFSGATDGTYTSKGLSDASPSLSWSSCSGFFSP